MSTQKIQMLIYSMTDILHSLQISILQKLYPQNWICQSDNIRKKDVKIRGSTEYHYVKSVET
jgi:hypothetical protein